uniref:Uncharacterized protein n=1 Tax=Tanacetum cinerariifolium TaxID=118510 RepID=A0A6L2JDE4_TANCI|nr:hypothetical protein [Tanacetum cinerariifolium]
MVISVILVSLDSSEDSVGEPTGRVILFGTIPTTIPNTTQVIALPTTQIDTIVIPIEIPIIAPAIPSSPGYTPASPDYSPASKTEFDPSEDPSSGHIPPLPHVLPFLSSDDDTTDSDTPATPPSPTHDILFTKITASTQRSPIIPHRRVMILAPGQPIPHGRPYRYHPNGALSHVRADLIPSPKRVRDIGYLADVEAIPVHHIQVIEGVQREQGHRTVGVESAVTTLTERVAELERDNRRLRGTVEELVARRVAEEMEAREAVRNLKTLNENEEEQEGENGGNENRGNEGNENGENGGNENGRNRGNGNRWNGGNGNHGINYGVPSLMAYFVTSLTSDGTRSCVMKSASLTQRMGSNIPTVFSRGSSIGPEGFMLSIMLLVVIIVVVVVIVVVVGSIPSIIKLSFVVIVLAMVAGCTSSAAVTLSATNCLMAA